MGPEVGPPKLRKPQLSPWQVEYLIGTLATPLFLIKAGESERWSTMAAKHFKSTWRPLLTSLPSFLFGPGESKLIEPLLTACSFEKSVISWQPVRMSVCLPVSASVCMCECVSVSGFQSLWISVYECLCMGGLCICLCLCLCMYVSVSVRVFVSVP